MPQEYALVYCYCRLCPSQVLFVKKSKPDWQRGLLNLPGGKIEEGETPEQAAIRELREETGYRPANFVKVMGTIKDGENVIYCCRIPIDQTYQPEEERPKNTQEPYYWLNWNRRSRDSRLIPNLRVIIPLLRTNVSGWTIEDNYRPQDESHHTIKIRLPTYR